MTHRQSGDLELDLVGGLGDLLGGLGCRSCSCLLCEGVDSEEKVAGHQQLVGVQATFTCSPPTLIAIHLLLGGQVRGLPLLLLSLATSDLR